jgi:hypothetical protein
MGLLFLIMTPVVLTSTQPGSVGGGIAFMAVGAYFVLVSAYCLLASARRIEGLGDGSFRFVSSRRTLLVAPGELIWIKAILLDPARILPMWARTTTGGMVIAPGMGDVEELFRALAVSNPAASIQSPTPKYRWPPGARS